MRNHINEGRQMLKVLEFRWDARRDGGYCHE